jgi:hypothetical protein
MKSYITSYFSGGHGAHAMNDLPYAQSVSTDLGHVKTPEKYAGDENIYEWTIY